MKPRLGIYRHYKGYDYRVIGLARIEASLEEVVVYQALYDTEDFGPNPIWVRPVTDFMQSVTVDGASVPRFVRIGD